MNTLIQERHNDRKTILHSKGLEERKSEVKWQKKGLLLHVLVQTWRRFSGILLAMKLEKEKGAHKQSFALDIVCIHFLKRYTNLNEYNTVGIMMARILRCFPFISKLKAGKCKAARRYINYLTFSILQFRPLLENSFQCFHIDLRHTSGEETAFVVAEKLQYLLLS